MKNNIKHVIFFFALAAMLFSVGSCKKDFLDVNNNMNSPENVDVKLALPSAQSYLGYTLGNQLSIVGGFWGQYWTQGPNANQYANLDQYVYNSADADRPWSALYAGTLKDLQYIYETGITDSTKRNYAAIARILQAYTYQVITDAWGDAPFSESLKGDAGNVTPHFESQEKIYDGILTMINEAQGMLDDTKEIPGTEDLVYNGDLFLWYEFANTLKLRVLLRQSEVRPTLAQTEISNMFANGEPFLAEGEDAKLSYSDQKYQQSPLYTTGLALSTSSNIFGSRTLIDYMTTTNDPRVFDYFAENGSGNIAGLYQGEGKTLGGNQSDGTWSKPSEQVIGPLAATFLMSAAESYFLQAEAIARGYAPGNDDQAAYETGVLASWGTWPGSADLVTSDLTAFLASDSVAYPLGGSVTEKLKVILTQKWIAMAGSQNFEAWTEWRRTRIPAFSPSITSVLAAGTFPGRIVYPSDEVTSNSNFPGIKTVDKTMWWDIH